MYACTKQEKDQRVSYAGTYYRNIQQSMLDMANMLTLLATSPQIQASHQDPSTCCTSPYAACKFSSRLHQHIVEHGILPHCIISNVGAGRSGRQGARVVVRSDRVLARHARVYGRHAGAARRELQRPRRDDHSAGALTIAAADGLAARQPSLSRLNPLSRVWKLQLLV